MKTSIIPKQFIGKKTDNEYSVTCNNTAEAKLLFEKAVSRLLSVNEWDKICKGVLKATFHLCDNNGVEVERKAQETDFFKIDIPGPGPIDGDGYDWVQIEHIFSHSEETVEIDMLGVKVRPASCPNNNKNSIAHFFSKDATSTFLVVRQKNIVTAEVHGRNEIPNTEMENVVDTVRNTVVANGANWQFSNIQWSKLVEGC